MPVPAALARLAGNRRKLVLAALALGALALAFAATTLSGGGEDPYASIGDVTASGSIANTGASLVAPVTPVTLPVPAPGHEHGDDSDTAPLHDPFCPRVVAQAAGLAVTCPEYVPIGSQPMTLLGVFVDGGHSHARVRLGTTVVVLHVNDAFDVYTVASLADRCGDFLRGQERRTLCEGETWDAPSPAQRP